MMKLKSYNSNRQVRKISVLKALSIEIADNLDRVRQCSREAGQATKCLWNYGEPFTSHANTHRAICSASS